MKTTKKTLLALLCAVLLVVSSVMGTLAYLTAETEKVTNTFTVGDVKFVEDAGLDEEVVDEYGNDTTPDTVNRTTENTYKLVPNHTYLKDPTLHIAAGSETCYVFVKVTNEIAAIETKVDADKTVAEQMTENGWLPVAEGSNIFYNTEKVVYDAEKDQDVVVFNNFKIDANVDNTTLAGYAGKTIVVEAYAVQADGFATAVAAWTAAPLAAWNA